LVGPDAEIIYTHRDGAWIDFQPRPPENGETTETRRAMATRAPFMDIEPRTLETGVMAEETEGTPATTRRLAPVGAILANKGITMVAIGYYQY